jgi:hypothetical protein
MSRQRKIDQEASGLLLAELRIILGDLRKTLTETKVVVTETKKISEHARAGVNQIASIESSIIKCFRPIVETVELHGKEIASMKTELKSLRVAVDALEHPEITEEIPV